MNLKGRLSAFTATILLASAFAPLLSFSVGSWQGAYAKGQKNTTDPAYKNTKLGKQLYEKKDYDRAIDALLQATYFARNGYAPEAFYYLGITYKAKGDYRKAKEALKKHLQQAVDDTALGNIALAEVLIELGELDGIEHFISAALIGSKVYGPVWCSAQYVHAKLDVARGNDSDAVNRFKDALGERPWTYFDAWIGLSECLMKMKKWSDAHKYLDELLTTNAVVKGMNYERTHLDLGICALAKGNHQGAIDNWHKCLEYNPDNREAHLQLAMILDAENHISSSIKEYRNFVRLCDDPKLQYLPKDVRSKQVENRIAMLEQKLQTEAPAPRPSVSPYSLKVEEKAAQERQRQAELERQRDLEEQMKKLPKDAGF